MEVNADVWYDCTTTSDKVGKAPKNSIYEFKNYLNGWYQIGEHLWVYRYDLQGNTVASETEEAANGIAIQYDTTKLKEFKLDLFAASSTTQNANIAPNGTQYAENDIAYLVNQGYSREAAIAQLSTSDKYTKTTTQEVRDILYKAYTNVTGAVDPSSFNGLRVRDADGIFGMPYQFAPHVDRRVDGSMQLGAFGRKFADKIVARMPLLIMVPGSPQFLEGYTKTEKEGALESLLGSVSGNSDIENLVNKPGKYYGLSVDWKQYFQYVNPMCRVAALYMGVGGNVYGEQQSALKDYDWSKNSNKAIHAMWNYKGGAAFYVNSESQISEGFSSSSSQSQLAEKINGISDLGREMQFLLGTASNLDPTNIASSLMSDKAKGVAQTPQGMASKLLEGPSLIRGITNAMGTVIAGGKLIFPEIWADSQYSRDYSIDIKLTSPDCDPLSIYLNIIVPLIHLVAFAIPKSTGPNGYISPFLVRGSYKGFLNVDMGLITSMAITKGGEGAWSASGVPTTVDVNFTLKELYNTMSMCTNEAGTYKITQNTALMDYLGNMCGININEPDITRSIAQYWLLYGPSRAEDYIKRNTSEALDQWVTNKYLNLFDVH